MEVKKPIRLGTLCKPGTLALLVKQTNKCASLDLSMRGCLTCLLNLTLHGITSEYIALMPEFVFMCVIVHFN